MFNRLYALWLAVLVFLALWPPYFFQAFDMKFYDLMVRSSAPHRHDQRVIIVGIDQKSLDSFGRWPWPRTVIGNMVEKLSGYGARVVALDVTFSSDADKDLHDLVERIDKTAVANGLDKNSPSFYNAFQDIRGDIARDEKLAQSIRKAGNVITGIIFLTEKEVSPSPKAIQREKESLRPFRIKSVRRSADSRDTKLWHIPFIVAEVNVPVIQEAGMNTGFFNAKPDQDGVIRRHPMVIEHRGDFYPSLAMVSVIEYLGAANDTQLYFNNDVFEGVFVGGKLLELDPYGRMLIRYLGPDLTFPVISAADVINGPPDSPWLKEKFNDKIVFVGATALGLYDLRSTPFGITAGVEIQANATATALNNNPITKFGWQRLYDMALALILGIGLWFAVPRMNVPLSVALSATLLVGLVGFNYYLFTEHFLWLNNMTPALAIVIGFISVTAKEFVTEQKSKRFIEGAFGRYLSPKVIKQIVENPDLLQLGGEKRVMSAFFSDVQGFTAISERLQPNELVALLNDYLTMMTDIIHDFDGTVDKFEGDAIIAFWGAPLHIENHAELSVRAAVRMQAKIRESQDKWRKEWGVELNTRMGINTGPMVVGNMGSKDRMDYTMMGDAVNLAARLEGANKYYGSWILVSQFTHEIVKDMFLSREVDQARVAGKKEPIRLYEVIAAIDDVTDNDRERVKRFGEAIELFRNRRFKEAAAAFEVLDRETEVMDATCGLYIRRCEELLAIPPLDSWDAVYDLAK